MAESRASPLHKDPGIHSRRRFHPPVRCRDLGSLSKADQTTGAILATMLALHPWHQMARLRVERRSAQESQPAWHRVHPASIAAALSCLVTRMEDVRMPKAVFLSELHEGKRDRGEHSKKALQRSAEETACTSGNQPSVMAAGDS